MIYQGVGYNEPCLERKSTRKGGKQYQWKRKRKTSEEDSIRSWKLRRSEKELKRVDDRPTPVAENHNSEDDSGELPDVQLLENQLHQLLVLFRTTPILPLGIYLKKLLTINLNEIKLKVSLLLIHCFSQIVVQIRHESLMMTIVDGPNP